jgi:hypothetical protein
MESVVNTTKSLKDIRDEVYFMLSERDSRIFSAQAVNRTINSSLAVVWAITHSESEYISRGITPEFVDIELPDAQTHSGVAVIDKVYFDNNELTKVPFSISEETGTPTSYVVMGNSIRLLPYPDTNGTLDIVYRLVDENDTTTMSDVEINAAVYHTCWQLKVKDEEWNAATAFKAMWDDARTMLMSIPAGVYRMSSSTDTNSGVL